jgi:hypothetical protein
MHLNNQQASRRVPCGFREGIVDPAGVELQATLKRKYANAGKKEYNKYLNRAEAAARAASNRSTDHPGVVQAMAASNLPGAPRVSPIGGTGSATNPAANMVPAAPSRRPINPRYDSTEERDQRVDAILKEQGLNQATLKQIATDHGVVVGGSKTAIARRLVMTDVDVIATFRASHSNKQRRLNAGSNAGAGAGAGSGSDPGRIISRRGSGLASSSNAAPALASPPTIVELNEVTCTSLLKVYRL